MRWIISHQSALEFWRKAHADEALAGKRLRATNPSAKPLNVKDLKNENPWNHDTPLHVLVGSDNARKNCRGLHCHISSGEFPDGSFIQMTQGLAVSSPELCFLQMAGELSFTDLVMLGYEFCGSYRLDSSDQGFRGDLPLTSGARLNSYITKAAGLKGRTKASRALRFIADGSASPMETILTLLLILPYRFGGYGFPKPQLNYRIDMPADSEKTAGKPYYICDLYWPDGKVDVEYDSDAYHTGPERIANDAIRRNALISVNVTVVTVTRMQIIDTQSFRKLAELLSQRLGKRLKYPKKEFATRHASLRREFFPKAPKDG